MVIPTLNEGDNVGPLARTVAKGPRWQRWRRLAQLGVIAAFVVWFYRPYLGPGLPPGDFSSDVMVKEVNRDVVGSPLAWSEWRPFLAWNSHLMCGKPTLQFPGPFSLLELPLRSMEPLARLKTLVVLFHVFSGLTMYALLTAVKAGEGAAFFGGIVYPVMASHISRSAVHGHVHLPMFWALLPLVALALFRLRRGDSRAIVFLALALAAALLRDTQRTVLTCVLVGVLASGWLVYGLVCRCARGDTRVLPRAAAFLFLFLAAFALAVAIEAFEIVNGFAGDPYRGGWTGGEQAYWLSRWSVDNLYSYVDWDTRLATWLRPHVRSMSPSVSRYLGVSLIAIVVAAIAARAIPQGQRARFTTALLLLGLSIWLSFGPRAVWPSIRSRWQDVLAAPGLSSIAKVALVAVPILSVALVVWMVARALHPARLRYPLALATTAGALALLLGVAPLPLLQRAIFFLRDFRNPDWFQIAVSSFAIAFAGGIATAGLVARAGARRGRFVYVALLLVAVLDVLPYRARLTSSQASPDTRTSLEAANRFIARDPQWGRVAGTTRYANRVDLGYIWHRKPLAWEFRSYTAPRRTLKFFGTLFDNIARRERLELLAPLAGLAGVKYLVEERGSTNLSGVKGLARRFEDEDTLVLENTAPHSYVRAYPRGAVLMGELRSSGVRLAAGLVLRNVALLSVEGPHHAGLLDGLRPVFIDLDDVPRTPGVPANALPIQQMPRIFSRRLAFAVEPTLSWTRPRPERIVVRVSSRAPLILTVSESYHPWWRASVDGRAAPVYPGGFAFLGMPIEAGEHEVELRFERPWSIALCGFVSLVSLATSLWFLWSTRGRKADGETLIPGC